MMIPSVLFLSWNAPAGSSSHVSGVSPSARMHFSLSIGSGFKSRRGLRITRATIDILYELLPLSTAPEAVARLVATVGAAAC
jgi:hypothetical protein